MKKTNNVKYLFLKLFNQLHIQSVEAFLAASIYFHGKKRIETSEVNLNNCVQCVDDVEKDGSIATSFKEQKIRTQYDYILEQEKYFIASESTKLKQLFSDPYFLHRILSNDRKMVIDTLESYYYAGLLTPRILMALISAKVITLSKEEEEYLVSIGLKQDVIEEICGRYFDVPLGDLFDSSIDDGSLKMKNGS